MRISERIRWFFKSPDPAAERLRRISKLLIVLTLLGVLFYTIPVKKLLQTLLTTDPWLFFLSILLTLLGDLLMAAQMKTLLDYQKIRRSLSHILHTNLAVRFYLQFTPSTLIASGIRWYRFAQPEGNNLPAFVALAFYRVFEVFLTLAIGAGFLLISAQDTVQVSYLSLAALLFAIAAAWVVVTRYSLPIYNWLKPRSGSLAHHRLVKPVLVQFEKLLEAASAYAKIPTRVLLWTIFLGIITSQIRIAANMFNAQAVGIDLSYLDIGWITMLVALVTQMPFTVAGGLGVREVTLVATLSLFGVSSEQALVYSFLIFIRNIVVALIGGLWELADTLRSRQAARKLEARQTAQSAAAGDHPEAS